MGLSQSETEELLRLAKGVTMIDRDHWMTLFTKHETAYRHLCLQS